MSRLCVFRQTGWFIAGLMAGLPASAAPAENGDGEPADNTKEPTETPPPSATQTPPVDEENIELPFVPAES